MFGGPFFDIECFLFIVHVVKNVSFGEPLRVVEVFRDVISGIVIRTSKPMVDLELGPLEVLTPELASGDHGPKCALAAVPRPRLHNSGCGCSAVAIMASRQTPKFNCVTT